MAAKYDISTHQGETFQLHATYKDNSNVVVDLTSYTGRLQVRRSTVATSKLIEADSSGVTVGITGGTGSVAMNNSATGGSSTGGILITVDAVSMSNVPAGRHFYDLELVSGGGTVSRLLEGRFDCSAEITR